MLDEAEVAKLESFDRVVHDPRGTVKPDLRGELERLVCPERIFPPGVSTMYFLVAPLIEKCEQLERDADGSLMMLVASS